jgi:hypothetical protein
VTQINHLIESGSKKIFAHHRITLNFSQVSRGSILISQGWQGSIIRFFLSNQQDYKRFAGPTPNSATQEPQGAQKLRQTFVQAATPGRECLPAHQELERYCHAVCQEGFFVPRRCADSMLDSLGEYLVTTLSSATVLKNNALYQSLQVLLEVRDGAESGTAI